ncbi:hypothetical protein, conserved [Trypanosoma brucei brucei TREU927]|uniref:Uncharacterized protein n=2 Tax=Trypanosoma brucei TaxID=5691 RepID=Q386I2_TRYB2|nr:p166 [Trypanosoma brucei brucei TREU927]ACJ38224.1 p166 [Trypanosoma brucei]EAN79299.1 hypothetical protein, conserved [Trypanosoma brucei brucei TREU927]
MRRVHQIPCKKLFRQLGRRGILSTPPSPVESAEPTTIRSRGYGPSKHLLRGVDATRGVVVEAALSPADVEMQRRVLSMANPNVAIHAKLEGEPSPVHSGTNSLHGDDQRLADRAGVASSEQLASVATVILDEVKEQLQLNLSAADASQDSRAATVVNAVAECLRNEVDRLIHANHTQESSITRVLRENTDLICKRVADVICSEQLKTLSFKDVGQLPQVIKEVGTSLVRLESALKSALDSSFGKDKNLEEVLGDLREHIVSAIEQASHFQQERLLASVSDLLADCADAQDSKSRLAQAASLKVIEKNVRDAMSQMVEDTQHKVQSVLRDLRGSASTSDAAGSTTNVSSGNEVAFERILASYGERLEELRESTAAAVDLKELMMEIHSMHQTSAGDVSEVKNLVKKLKRELISALQPSNTENTEGSTVERKSSDTIDYNGIFADKLDALADDVISRIDGRLKEQHADVRELSARLLQLEDVIKKTPRAALQVGSVPELNDDRLLALAQSISESILSSLPPHSAPAVEEKEQQEPPRPSVSTAVATTAHTFTATELAEAVSAALTPRLDELAAAIQKKVAPTSTASGNEYDNRHMGETQLVTVAQTICEGVREAVRESMALYKPPVASPPTPAPGAVVAPAVDTSALEQAMVTKVEDLKRCVMDAVQEMDRPQEIDLSPFRTYLDDVLRSMQTTLSKQQQATQDKVDGVVEALAKKLQDYQHQLESKLQRQHRDQVEQIQVVRRAQEQDMKADEETWKQRMSRNQEDAEQRTNEQKSAVTGAMQEVFLQVRQRLTEDVRTLLKGEVAAALIPLDDLYKELRESGQKSRTALEAKLRSVEDTLQSVLDSERHRSDRLQATLDDVIACIKNNSGEVSGSETEALKSLKRLLEDLAERNTATGMEICSDVKASLERTEELHVQTAEKMLRGFDTLKYEIHEGRQQLDQLLSSNQQNKDVALAVEAMRTKLDEVRYSLDCIMASVREMQEHPMRQLQEPQQQQQSLLSETEVKSPIDDKVLEQYEQRQREASDLIASRLETLSATTREVLSQLQRQQPRRSEEEMGSQPAVTTNLSVESLQAMEGRLGERMQALQAALDELTKVSASVPPTTEVFRKDEVDGVEGSKSFIKEVDELMTLVKSSRSVQAKQMWERLSILRTSLVDVSTKKTGDTNIKQLLGALEENRLKLREEMGEAERELVIKIDAATQKAVEHFAARIERAVKASADAGLGQLRNDLKESSEILKAHQHQFSSQLQDRMTNIERTNRECAAELKEKLRDTSKEYHNALGQFVKNDMIAALRSTVNEATTQQMRTFTQQFTWQKEREETNKEAVMRSVQQVSQGVGKLQSMSSEVRTAVTSSSAGVVQEVRNAQKDLAVLFEKRLAAVLEQQKKQQVVQVLSPVRVGEADSSNGIPSETTDTPSLVTMVNPQGASHLSWFLLSQSVVTIITIMLCAYFLFAAFLVAFVPIPLTDEFASHMEQAADNDVSEIALKRPLVSRVADRVIL